MHARKFALAVLISIASYASANPSVKTQRAIAYIPRDLRFKTVIEKALATNPNLRGTTIRVDPNTNEVIYLWGKVRTASQKTLAWRITKHVAPGFPVVNLLRVQAKRPVGAK